MSQITATGCQNAPTRFFPSGQINARLAPDGGVDLTEQGRGDVDHRHTPVVDRGREASHVGHHSPAHADNEVCSGQPEFGEGPAKILDGAEGFRLFALADEKNPLLQPRLHVHPHGPLGDDGGLPGTGRQKRAQLVPGAPADQDEVRPFSKLYCDLPHGGFLMVTRFRGPGSKRR